jgi:hypothetical protein
VTGVFIALAIAQQLELKPGRREASQNAVVEVTSEPYTFSGGRSLFGLVLQNLPVEFHSDPGRDKLDQQQNEITPATTVQNENPPSAEDSHKRCSPDATNLESSNEFVVHDRRLLTWHSAAAYSPALAASLRAASKARIANLRRDSARRS